MRSATGSRGASKRPPARRAKRSLGSVPGSRTINATKARNSFDEILKGVRLSGRVFIENFGKTTAVVLSVKEYETLVRGAQTPASKHLRELREAFEELYLAMQVEKSNVAVDGTPSESTGKAKRAAARPRKRK